METSSQWDFQFSREEEFPQLKGRDTMMRCSVAVVSFSRPPVSFWSTLSYRKCLLGSRGLDFVGEKSAGSVHGADEDGHVCQSAQVGGYASSTC